MAKTAIDILIDTINKFPELFTKEWVISQCQEIKHEERQQIEEAYRRGCTDTYGNDEPNPNDQWDIQSASDYYTKTYSNDK